MKLITIVFILLTPFSFARAQNTTGLVVSNCGVLGTAYGPAGRPGPPTIDTPPATSPTDIFTISGSATKTVIVKKLLVSGTANGTIQGHVALLKRSSANSGGTSTAVDIVSYDSTNSAATAVVRSYTANPTLGTLVGLVRAAEYTYIAASSNLSNFPIEFKFGEEENQGVVLRGSGELLAINLNGVSMNNSVIDISVEWREIVE